MAKDRNDRYPDAKAFAHAIEMAMSKAAGTPTTCVESQWSRVREMLIRARRGLAARIRKLMKFTAGADA